MLLFRIARAAVLAGYTAHSVDILQLLVGEPIFFKETWVLGLVSLVDMGLDRALWTALLRRQQALPQLALLQHLDFDGRVEDWVVVAVEALGGS